MDDSGGRNDTDVTLTATAVFIGLRSTTPINYATVESLNVNTSTGGDAGVLIRSTQAGTQTTVRTAVGNHFIELGSAAPNLGGTVNDLAGPITIIGNGQDTLVVDDSGDTTANSGTLTGTTITGLGMGSGVSYSGIALLDVNLGSGADTFGVAGTNATTTTTVNAGAGDDAVVAGAGTPASVDGIAGALTINGEAGADTLTVDDSGDTSTNTGTLTATTLTGLGMGPRGLTYGTLETLNVNLGSGNDTFTVSGANPGTTTSIHGNNGDDRIDTDASVTTGVLLFGDGGNDVLTGGGGPDTLDGGAGNDTVQGAGGDDALIVTALAGALADGGAGVDRLTVRGTSAADSLGVSATQVTLGSAPSDVVAYTTVEQLTVEALDGADQINVLATSVSTSVSGGAGDDRIQVGERPPFGIAGVVNIDAALTVNGDAGNDSVVVEDLRGFQGSGVLTSTSLTGLSMGPGGLTYGTVEALDVILPEASAGLSVRSTNAATTTRIQQSIGVFFIRVGSVAPNGGGTLDGIAGALAIQDGGGRNFLVVDDSGGTTGRSGTLTTTALTGLGMGPAGITFTRPEQVEVGLGSGADTLTVTDTGAGSITTISGNDGTDTINVRAAHGDLRVDAGAGDDVFTVGSLASTLGGTLNGVAARVVSSMVPPESTG